MHPSIRILIGMLLPAALAGCGGPDYQPPDVKTHPDPKQRYAITVTLVDPPPGIRSITGMTHFFPNTSCIPTNDPINHTDAVSVFYEKKFDLIRVSDNTYRGHIYLDWPVDEDYYGLGVCKWELATAKVYLNRVDYAQDVMAWGEKLPASSSRQWNWWCPNTESKNFVSNCFRPEDPMVIEKAKLDHFKTILTIERN